LYPFLRVENMDRIAEPFHLNANFKFQGEKHIFQGPALLSETPGLVTGENPEDPDGFRSIMCDCAMAYISCVPEDKFEVVLYCDASMATVSFRKGVG
jgi:hypothetical protein